MSFNPKAAIILVVALLFIAFVWIGGLRFDHEVRTNSHQYQEAKDSQAATLEANLAEVQVQLSNPKLSAAERNDLRAKEAALRVQIRAANKTRN